VIGDAARALLGWIAGAVARLWLATLRVHLRLDPGLAAVDDRPWVLAFWHGAQWPLLAWRRRRPTVVLVSWSRDGGIQARALAVQGFRVVRGSSSRGGARGLAALVRAMRREGADAAFAVDGPRGPRGVVKAGVVAAARATGAVIVPMAGRVRRGMVFRRTWDRFAIAWPFTRVEVVLGSPLEPDAPVCGRSAGDGPVRGFSPDDGASDARVAVERALTALQRALDGEDASGSRQRREMATASISTSAARGKAATWTVDRAG
jgi:lysophospholipid acyltransferase (LPLAT)-like uncharacterized protein